LIRRIELPVPGIEKLRAEAAAGGYTFLDTLVEDWATGRNRFDGPGEALFGFFDNGRLVAIGGLNVDPLAGQADMGRIRRVYVMEEFRNRGIGWALMKALMEEARKGFARVRLRAGNADAARLYERLGFEPLANSEATHILHFEP
jgi:GNAT superfamily N-acetyltransferase